MPLIVMCGFPSSGKTSRSTQIMQYFIDRFNNENKPNSVHLINDESLGISKDSYKDTRLEEKKSRGILISAVERMISKDDLLIVDGMNYIKGFRYQLYCIARAIGTPHCVVYCGIPVEIAKEWNSKRVESGYDTTVFDELVSRFEEPDDRNRWDSPLFTVFYNDEAVPFDGIWDAVINKKAKPPNLSTVSKPVSETNYLYELEKTTQDIINEVLDAQKHNVGGGAVKISRTNRTVNLPSRTITLSEFRRLRRQFTNINKMHTLLDMDRVAELFVEYLNTNINR
ncbi:chromatin associated protein KTI12 [Rhizophagus irregularis]|uniref:Chromatin associated protein KTI12 n=1 Tax=Rhizophagus irregularis TaxID=588596 RepID=A0A2I1G6V1_9GLOM|nr:chromatin associated protein KTI12 [Rhizophagus irregularis]